MRYFFLETCGAGSDVYDGYSVIVAREVQLIAVHHDVTVLSRPSRYYVHSLDPGLTYEDVVDNTCRCGDIVKYTICTCGNLLQLVPYGDVGIAYEAYVASRENGSNSISLQRPLA